jgi:hypothetical protein
MKLLSHGRLAAAGCLLGFVLLAVGRVVPSPEASIGLTAVATLCFLGALGALQGLNARLRGMLEELQTKQTTKA